MLRNILNTVVTATLIMLLGVSSSAKAMVPANTRITSTSILELSDGKTLTESVTVTVGLQRSKPEIALQEVTVDGAPFDGDPGDVQWLHGKTKTLTYKYTITTTANGQATYNVTAAVDKEGLSEAPSTEVDGDTISLGATAAISNQGLVVTVPYDGAADNKINGISQYDTVVINNQPYEVNNLRDSADASTLTLDKDPGELSPGTPIAEQQEYTVTLLGVVLADDAPEGGTNPTLTITATQGAGFEGFDAAPNNQSFLVTAVVLYETPPTNTCGGGREEANNPTPCAPEVVEEKVKDEGGEGASLGQADAVKNDLALAKEAEALKIVTEPISERPRELPVVGEAEQNSCTVEAHVLECRSAVELKESKCKDAAEEAADVYCAREDRSSIMCKKKRKTGLNRCAKAEAQDYAECPTSSCE